MFIKLTYPRIEYNKNFFLFSTGNLI